MYILLYLERRTDYMHFSQLLL